MNRRGILAGSAAAMATTLLRPRPGFAQSYPSRPVRIVVPYSPGQGSDIFARIFAEHLGGQLGQTFLVDNRPGAGGNIGSAAAARAEPDGYTLLWGTNGTHAGNEFMYANLGFDPVKDFEPVAGVLRFGMVLAVARESRIRSMADFLAAARAEPGRLSAGLPSTTARAVLHLVRDRTGIECLVVPYTGSGQALTGLLRNDVQVVIDTVTAALGPIRSDQMRPIALSTERRSESIAEVPTLREAGIDATLEAWNALYAPRGTPPEIVRSLNRAIGVALADAAIKARLVKDGADPLGGTGDDLAALMRRDRDIWGPIVRGLGLAVQ